MVRDRNGRIGAGRRRWSAAGIVVAIAAPLLGGCVTETAYHPQGPTIAFESVDGPPREVFDRLVARLDAAAQSRQVAVVSRKVPARYRVRVYLAAKVEAHRTAIDWIWDVYDSDLQRAIRIGGEARASREGDNKGWAVADDRLLGQIAEAGMTQLAAFTAASDGPQAAPEAAPAEPVHPPAAPPAEGIRVAAAAPPVAGPIMRTR